MSNYEFGMIGLGTMGRSLLLNMVDHGYSVAGYDLDPVKAQALQDAAGGKALGTSDLATFIGSLRVPRAIMMLVPAGGPVDSVIQTLLPHLQPGDVIIDGGNSYFKDTDRRFLELQAKGIEFVGMGVSGGEEGARRGPSMMPGGSSASYERIMPVLESVAAKGPDGAPCVARVGNGSAGHYVKMVHNGIEYGLMQLISETYDVLKRGLGHDQATIIQNFQDLATGDSGGFLLEITATVLAKLDADGTPLVDKVKDQAKGKGTGKWTSQDAMDLGIPIPVIDTSVNARELSSLKEERVAAESLYAGLNRKISLSLTSSQVANALRGAMLLTYAQGLALIAEASKEYKFDVPMVTVARIWRAGCIIRSKFLPLFMDVYEEEPNLENPLLSPLLAKEILAVAGDLRAFCEATIAAGIATPCHLAAIAYLDGITTGRGPANIIQAQRDFFGAHTYERTDQTGTFHTNWSQA